MAFGAQGVPAIATGRASSSPNGTIGLYLTDDVFASLGRIADTLGRETVRCLIGGFREDSLILDIAWEPLTWGSTTDGVHFSECPVATVALWHNHLPSPERSPDYSCSLSDIDIHGAIQSNAPPMQFVQVSSGVICWWYRGQILAASNDRIMWPLPNQRYGRHVTLADACAGSGRFVRPCALLDEPVQAVGEDAPDASADDQAGISLSGSDLSVLHLSRSLNLLRNRLNNPKR